MGRTINAYNFSNRNTKPLTSHYCNRRPSLSNTEMINAVQASIYPLLNSSVSLYNGKLYRLDRGHRPG